MALNINGTTGISGVDGSASAPALQGTDSNTGINFASDTVNINTGGVTRATVDSAGRVGIGTTSPSSFNADGRNLVVGTGSGGQGLSIYSANNNYGNIYFADGTSDGSYNAGGILYNHSSNFMRFDTAAVERMRIDSNGQFLVGTTASSAYGNRNMAVGDASDSSSFIEIRTSSSGTGHLLFAQTAAASSGNYQGFVAYNHSSNYMSFHTNGGNERMRIDSSGKLEAFGNRASANAQLFQNVSSTNPEGLYIQFTQAAPNTSARHFLKCSDNVGDKAVIDSNGNSRNLNNSYGGFSDVSLKENIVDAGSQWNDIKNTKVRVFNFKTDDASKKRIGVIAQEIETVCPKLVDEVFDKDSDGELLETSTKSVKYSVLYMKAVKCLQEAIAKIETLETKVAALEAG